MKIKICHYVFQKTMNYNVFCESASLRLTELAALMRAWVVKVFPTEIVDENDNPTGRYTNGLLPVGIFDLNILEEFYEISDSCDKDAEFFSRKAAIGRDQESCCICYTDYSDYSNWSQEMSGIFRFRDYSKNARNSKCIHSVCLSCSSSLIKQSIKTFTLPMCPICRVYIYDMRISFHNRKSKKHLIRL